MSSETGSSGDSFVQILLVDDERRNLLVLESILEPLGHRMVQAESGQRALELFERESFAVALLDVRMPGLGGLQTASTMQDLRLRTPIIFITASDDASEIDRAYESGAADYLVKPLNPTALRAKVSVFVELFRQRGDARLASAAAEANAKYRAFFEQGSAMTALLSPAGLLLEANRAFWETSGFERNQVVRQPLSQCGWWARTQGELDMVRTACAQAAGGYPFRGVLRYSPSDGSTREMALHLDPILGEHGVIFLALSAIDVTERNKLSNELGVYRERLASVGQRLVRDVRPAFGPLLRGLAALDPRAASASSPAEPAVPLSALVQGQMRAVEAIVNEISALED